MELPYLSNKYFKSICLFTGLFIGAHSYANFIEKKVSNSTELASALASSKPGDVIIMKDGEWKDVDIDFSTAGTANKPITLKAETAGKVILNGSSKLTLSKDYCNVEGLFFKEGAIKKGAVINFNATNCTVSNTAVVDYNPPVFKTKYYWVFFNSSYNTLSHCFFKGKNNVEPVLGNAIDGARHNTVSYCYFKDIPFAKQNGREILRIWGPGKLGAPSDDGAFFTVDHNLFDHADGEGSEIISLKSNHNIVKYNTIRATLGGITSRQGHDNVFQGNFILGENREGTKGIRVAGQNHHVFNNYISEVAEGAILLMAGEYTDSALTSGFEPGHAEGTSLGAPRYWYVKNNLFENNTVINSGETSVVVGDSYRKHWPEMQMILLPENNTLKNNLVVNSKEAAVEVVSPFNDAAINFLHFFPNKFEGNIYTNGTLKGNITVNGMIKKSVKVALDKNGLLVTKSIADVKSVGATEYISNPTICHPLTANEVGVNWMNK